MFCIINIYIPAQDLKRHLDDYVCQRRKKEPRYMGGLPGRNWTMVGEETVSGKVKIMIDIKLW